MVTGQTARKLVTRAAEVVGCSEHRANKLGEAAQWTAIAAGYGAERLKEKYSLSGHEKDKGEDHETIAYDSEEDDQEKIKTTTISHEALAKIYDYVCLAQHAYEDTSMADTFGFVKKSHYIKNVRKPCHILGPITTNTKVHVCVIDEETVTFAFRGTEFHIDDWRDVLTDLDQRQAPMKLYNASDKPLPSHSNFVKAHKGFQLALEDVTRSKERDENLCFVLEDLGMPTSKVKHVICTGHSLGGALATLCAYWCRYVAFPKAKIKCITIGSPRVGNLAFALDFNANVIGPTDQGGCSYRLVHKGDIVPHIPHLHTYPRIFSAYKHVSGVIHLSEHQAHKKKIVLKEGSPDDISAIDRVKFSHKCIDYIKSIDHILAMYNRGS